MEVETGPVLREIVQTVSAQSLEKQDRTLSSEKDSFCQILDQNVL